MLTAEGGQALLGVAAVRLDVQGGQRLDRDAPGVVEVPEGDKVVGQGPGLVRRPGVEGSNELVRPDEAVHQGKQPEEEMAVGGHARAPIGARPRRHPGASDPESIVGTLHFQYRMTVRHRHHGCPVRIVTAAGLQNAT